MWVVQYRGYLTKSHLAFNWYQMRRQLASDWMSIGIGLLFNQYQIGSQLVSHWESIGTRSMTFLFFKQSNNILTRGSFGGVKMKNPESNSTRGSSSLHHQKNPVSEYCLIVKRIRRSLISYQLTLNRIPIDSLSDTN